MGSPLLRGAPPARAEPRVGEKPRAWGRSHLSCGDVRRECVPGVGAQAGVQRQALTAAGHRCAVPSLLGVAVGTHPTWPEIVRRVARAARPLPGPATLVVHSNAALFVPAIVEELGERVARVVFADAPLPDGIAPAGQLRLLRELADQDGPLPPWTTWFAERDVAAMLPDPEVRRRVEEEQPRLPLAHFEQTLPAVDGWRRLPCAYLRFSPAYESVAAAARARGWPVTVLPGGHLHQVVAPEAVAAYLMAGA
ncbi:alpha/beta fold hydrolase [Streptomyces sp. E11-3]|uniref:alpha/beta fold hydrolase n=1 Tax=Streptomyces sp. E11-3 TaxID=3110112 RepID=UPI00397F423A